MKEEITMKLFRFTKSTVLSLIALGILLTNAGCAGRLISPVYDPVPPGSTNAPILIGYIANTNAAASLGTIRDVGSVLPPPAGTVIGGGASLLLAGLGLYARLKSKQALQASDILAAVITGVEAAGKTNPTNSLTKAAIASHVAAAGYGVEFDKTVQDVSRNAPN